MCADCEVCGGKGTVGYAEGWEPDHGDPPYCACEDCGARFEVEVDADYDGEKWVDGSSPGKRIFQGPKPHEFTPDRTQPHRVGRCAQCGLGDAEGLHWRHEEKL